MSGSVPLSLARVADRLLSPEAALERLAVLTVISHPRARMVGGRILVGDTFRLGSLDDPGADDAAEELGRRGLAGDPEILPGRYVLPLTPEGEAEVYLELHHPPAELVIVGAGHLARPLCTLGALLGLDVTVLDDRPDFATRERFPEAARVEKVDFSDPFLDVAIHSWSHVLLVTRGHRYDFECLRKLLQLEASPSYVGMIGSRRRVRATFQALLEEGFSPEALREIRAPIGLDIGARTPAEIAVCVAAEIIQAWRGGTCRPLRDVEKILDRLEDGPAPASSDPKNETLSHEP